MSKLKLIVGSLIILLISQILGCGSRVYGKNSEDKQKQIESSTKNASTQKIPQIKPKAVALIDKNRKIIQTKACKLIKFDAKESFDPDGDSEKLRYKWSNIAANTISQNQSFVHKYDKKGLYEATLKVTDEQKLSSIDRVCILVGITKNEIPLIAKAGEDQKITENTKTKLDGRAVCRDDIVKYEWREGSNILSTQASFEQNFKMGQHIIELIIEDKKGNKASDEIIVSVIPN